jgi:lantibiotic leader peptide-processing serine protease
MRRARILATATAGAMVAAGLTGVATTMTATAAPAAQSASGETTTYLVLAKKGVTGDALSGQLRSLGATVTSVNSAIGLVSARSSDAQFRTRAQALGSVQGVTVDAAVGTAPSQAKGPDPVEKEHVFDKTRANGTYKAVPEAPEGGDPLDGHLWGMEMINAFEARATEKGDKVRVGILDTGVDASHIDLRDNFDSALSRNFTTDIPAIDGPCDTPSCVDPATVDNNGHGTHVAGTIAASLNGFGVSGAAPDAEIVNIRGGQDSGYFFLGPVTSALTYAADNGLDVVNMSFYVDPWLYNCVGGAPEDRKFPEAVAEQMTIITAMNRALEYAHAKGVTLVGALGNNHEDLTNPRHDFSSPDYDNPAYSWDSAPWERTIDNASCYDLPVEGPHVLGVSALGPSGLKADYSNYATGLAPEIELSAPGGWYRDGFGTDSFMTNGNLILSTASLAALQESGQVDKNGNITKPGRDAGVIKECTDRRQPDQKADCSYYEWLQGTSMAAPHASGVAALAVGAHGTGTSAATFGLAPDTVGSLLMSTATDHACPAGGVQSYTREGRSEEFTATCTGTPAFNSFYGAGIVNALGVVQ